MVNPRNSFEVGGSSQPHDTYHEQEKMVVTLRNGCGVKTRPEEPKKDARESSAKPNGYGAERVSKGKEVTPPSSSFVSAVAPSCVPKAPFPTCLETASPFSKRRATMDEMLDVFKQVKINLPLPDAIK